MLGWGRALLKVYNTCLHRKPLLTQIATTGALWGVGDAIAQKVERLPKYDLRRGLLTASYGAIAVGPFGHAWYMTLDRMATRLFVEGSAKFIGFKVALDTAIFGPLHVLGYFSYMELGMGGTWAQAKAKIAKDFWPTFGAEIVIWPPLQTINFMHVPPTHHLLVVNIITIIDSSFMSWCCATDDWVHVLLPALKRRVTLPAPSENKQADLAPTAAQQLAK